MNLKLRNAILSMSTLTVMAAAAISPALSEITKHFSQVDPTIIKLLVSIPAIFIIISSIIFYQLTKLFNIKTLCLIGVGFYIIGGFGPFFFDNLFVIFIFRAILGIAVGIIMPLSTGLLSYYFDQNQQEQLLGYSSSMNNLGAVLGTILAGYLGAISWNYAFGVYLIALVVFILVFLYIPKDHFKVENSKLNKQDYQKILPFLTIIFVMMISYFTMPMNLSIVVAKNNIIPVSSVGLLMSLSASIAFLLGFVLVKIVNLLKVYTKYLGFLLLSLGLLILAFMNNLLMAIIGISCLGFALGLIIPLVNEQMSTVVSKNKVASVMSKMSVALYLGQFFSPIVIDFIVKTLNIQMVGAPFLVASIFALALFFFAFKVDYKL